MAINVDVYRGLGMLDLVAKKLKGGTYQAVPIKFQEVPAKCKPSKEYTVPKEVLALVHEVTPLKADTPPRVKKDMETAFKELVDIVGKLDFGGLRL